MHPELFVTQFADSAGYSKLRVKLHILNPVEVSYSTGYIVLVGRGLCLVE